MSVERVGILIQQQGGKEALALMKQLDAAISKLNRRKKFNTLSGLEGARAELQKYTSELQRLQNLQKNAKRLGLPTKPYDATINSYIAKIRDLSREYDLATSKSRTLGEAMRSTFNGVSSVTMHAGQQMQVLGKTLMQISSPMRTLFRSTIWAAGFKALNMVTQGFSESLSRYDVMKNYSRTLEAFGFEAKDASKAIGELEQSVLGLPTGLDEIVAVQKRFLASSQDIKKATGLAIAYNNAILASGSDARQQKTAQRILTQLSGGAEIASSSWDALQRAIPLVFTQLAKEAEMKVPEYMAALKAGKISTDEFNEAFTKIGTEGSIQDAANVMKMSFEGLTANITNATKRMGEGVLQALDDVFKGYNGRSLLQNLLGVDEKGKEVGGGIKHIINGFSESVQGWIRANPDFILDFLNTLKSFDWGGLIRGMGKGIQQTIQDIQKLFDIFNKFTGGDAEGVGKFLARAPMYGRILIVAGGMLKGLRGVIGAVATFAALPLLIKAGGITGLFSKVLGGATAAGAASQATGIATTATSLGTASKAMVSLFKNVALLSGSVLIVSGTGFLAFKAFKSMMSDLKEMTDIANDIDWDTGTEVLYHMVGFFGVFATLSGILAGLPAVSGAILGGEVILGAITTLASGILALNMKMLKSAFKNFNQITDHLKQGMDNLSQVTSHSVPTKTIGRAIDTFNEVYNMLKPKHQGQGIQNMRTGVAKRMKNNIKAMGDVIKSIVDFQKTSKEMQGIGEIPASTVTKVQRLFERLGEIHEAISQSFATKASVSQAKDARKILTNTKEMFKTLTGKDGVLAQIGKVGEEIPKITEGAANKLKLGKKTVEVQKLKSPLEQAREGMTTLFEEIGKMFDGFAGKIGFNAESNTTLASRIVDNVNSMFDGIIGKDGIIAQIGKIAPELKKITNAPTLNGLSPMQDAEIYLGSLFKFLGNVYKKLTDSKEGLGMYQNVTEGSSSTANEIIGNVQSMFNTLLGEEGIIAQISNMLPQIQPLFKTSGEDLSPLQNVELYVGQLFDSIRRIYDSFNGEGNKGLGSADMTAMSESIALLPQIMTNIQDAVNTISGMGKKMSGLAGEDNSFPIIGQIKNMISQLSQAFSAESIGVLQAQVEGFKQTISNLLDSISDMTGLSEGNPLEVAITITHTITETVTDAIKQAKSDIDAAWATIPTSLSRVITINISYRKNVSPFPSLGVPGASTGGYISGDGKVLYRAGGGNIPMFKPRGTDTVPAMLTPGEYVTRKKAVDFFGIDFMQKINRLDVRGAIESLMARASGMSGIGRQTVINNTYNNNQKVVQNINTNSPDFAFKSASRFAGAF